MRTATQAGDRGEEAQHDAVLVCHEMHECVCQHSNSLVVQYVQYVKVCKIYVQYSALLNKKSPVNAWLTVTMLARGQTRPEQWLP